ADTVDPLQTIAPTLRTLPSVTAVTLLAHTPPSSRFEIHTDKGIDVREGIFHLAVRNHWVLLEMHRKVTTLEEVFHKLTTT
ncbi:MAG: hypothetical protein IT282_08925, partial [Bacteroidetes bacterium]|nr:hypothetical protein [Bacteroidota bacterium]